MSENFERALRCVAISDTHGMYRELHIPEADVLLHAGDITRHGKIEELKEFNDWLGKQPHTHKLLIAGNHDWAFEREPESTKSIITNGIYLQDQEYLIDGVKFYGAPWSPKFMNWAFSLERGGEIKERWDLIPDDVDVLITHCPCYCHLDQVGEGEHVGCFDLYKAIQRIQPQFHVCGHIHEGYGVDRLGDTTCFNVSVCTRRYRPVNPPIQFTVSART